MGAAGANRNALVLGKYRGAPQRRTGRRSDWSKAMATKFVETLAKTCNVTLAAGAIERSVANCYKWRGKDASFRAAWDRALAIGYSRLELMLLERALHGVEKVVVARDGTSTVMRDYPDRVALTLLRMHRETAALADESIDGREHEEACERIIAKLGRLKERDAATEAEAEVEIKTMGARLAFIRDALVRCALIRSGLKARGGEHRYSAGPCAAPAGDDSRAAARVAREVPAGGSAGARRGVPGVGRGGADRAVRRGLAGVADDGRARLWQDPRGGRVDPPAGDDGEQAHRAGRGDDRRGAQHHGRGGERPAGHCAAQADQGQVGAGAEAAALAARE